MYVPLDSILFKNLIDNKKINVENTNIEAISSLGTLENKIRLLILENTKNSKINKIVINIITFIISYFFNKFIKSINIFAVAPHILFFFQ